MRQVFISYSEVDEAIAARISRLLEEHDVPHWYYGRDFVPGRAHLDVAYSQINESDVFLVIVSPAALASDFVFPEVLHAVAAGCRILPVLHGMTYKELEGRHLRWVQAFGMTTAVQWQEEAMESSLNKILLGVTSGSHPRSTDSELNDLRREIGNRVKSYHAELKQFIAGQHDMQTYYRFYRRLSGDPTDKTFFYLSRFGGDPRYEKMSLEYLLRLLSEKTPDATVKQAVDRALRFIDAAREGGYDHRLDESVIAEFSDAFGGLSVHIPSPGT